MKKRILTTTIPSWSKGSDTFSSLLEGYGADKVANIYIHSDLPDSKSCAKYFHIIENNVIKSILMRKISTGRYVLPDSECEMENNQKISRDEKRIYSIFTRYRFRIFLWLRELGWKLGRWNSRELNKFITDFDPEVFMFPIESYAYFNRINKYIIDTYQPKKVIGFLWDDNFTYKQRPYNILYKIERYFLRKQVRSLINRCTDVLSISPKMKEECDATFGIESIVLTKPIKHLKQFEEYNIHSPVNILYTGKLNIGRDQALSHIVEVLKRSKYSHNAIQIDVYTNTNLTSNLKSRLEKSGFCHIHPPVPQSEVFELQKQADVLLFLESLSNKDLTARLSFSTKLTDYFAAGKCIWAVGNTDLGPMSYLSSQDAGVVCGNDKEIADAIENFMSNPSLISDYAHKSYNCGLNHHNYNDIVSQLNQIIES